MSPLGKFTFALLGLRFFGADGFFLGMLLGHLLIDRTVIIKRIELWQHQIDDNIRLLLPYRWYRYYNRLDGNFWGKIWGAVLGGLLYGFNGFIFLFIVGHFAFDTPNSRHAKKFRKDFDIFWNRHWCKILGGIIGFILHSRVLLFSGIIIGFFLDNFRLERSFYKGFGLGWLSKFWRKISPLKLALHSKEARKVSFIQAIAGLAAKVAKSDGPVNESEIRVFKKIFEIPADENSKVGKIFNKAKQSAEDYKPYVDQLKILSEGDLNLKETIIENLFKIVVADGPITPAENKIMEKIARKLGIPQGNFEILRRRFEPTCGPQGNLQDDYGILGVFCNASDAEIKNRWKKLIVQYHPDRLQARGASAEEIKAATQKMAEINNAYQNIMKSRKIA